MVLDGNPLQQYGVPQGSILGLTLFVVCIKRLLDDITCYALRYLYYLRYLYNLKNVKSIHGGSNTLGYFLCFLNFTSGTKSSKASHL